MENPQSFLLQWFGKLGPIPGDSPEQKLQTNFFEAGLVDSFGVIELVSAIEEKYGIQFSETHFQERRFSTIGGLSEIMSELATADTHENS